MKINYYARLVFVLFLTLLLVIPSVSAAPGGGQKYYVNGYVKTNTGVPIFGASVKLYVDGSYVNTVTTQSNGYFSGSIYSYTIPRTWKAVASKTGYLTATKTVRCGTEPTTYMGTINLWPLPPVPTEYFIHGYVKNIYNNDPVSGASITIFGDGSQIGSTTTDQYGYYSHTYSTLDTISYCRVVASAPDYYENDKVVSVSGSDIDMGTLNLFHIWGFEKKYAVIVGISDYEYASDLHYADNDASDWYDYLTEYLAFESTNVWVYGDGHPDNYPKYDGLATEANVIAALEYMVTWANPNDIVCFITSGHGDYDSGDDDGDVYLCMWDCELTEEEGKLRDSEIADIFEDSVAAKNFFFFDNCHSGGIGPELMALANAENTLVLTTCTWEGYGFDYTEGMVTGSPGNYVWPEEGNGLWTHYFLNLGLKDYFGYDPFIAMEDAFNWASANYPDVFYINLNGVDIEQFVSPEDKPEMFDGYNVLPNDFILWY